jgi:hypothetical protein
MGEVTDSSAAAEQAKIEEWRKKRAQRQQRQQHETNVESRFLETPVDTSYEMTLAKRRKLEQQAFLQDNLTPAQRRKQAMCGPHVDESQNNNHADADTLDDSAHAPTADEQEANGDKVESLLEQAAVLQSLTAKEREDLQKKDEENRILREASKVQTNALQAATEVAAGTIYKDPMPSSWTVPRYILDQGPEEWQKVRNEWHMEVEGNHIPPAMKRFVDMKFPLPIIQYLNQKGIKKPTPIQMQGLPVALAGRDMYVSSEKRYWVPYYQVVN